MTEEFNLQRFVDAQEWVYDEVVRELSAGRKRSHWMWFIFPQIRGLGMSRTSQKYAISGRAEARAYLAHPVLGQRLRQCVGVLLELKGSTALEIFGGIDSLKLRSSLTLFALTNQDNALFNEALQVYFEGELDNATLEHLADQGP